MLVMPGNIGRLQARARRDIGLVCLIRAIRRATDQHKTPVAIAAIDIAMLVDLQPHARMAERGWDTVMRAVTSDAGGGNAGDFGWRDHGCCDSNGASGQQARVFTGRGIRQ